MTDLPDDPQGRRMVRLFCGVLVACIIGVVALILTRPDLKPNATDPRIQRLERICRVTDLSAESLTLQVQGPDPDASRAARFELIPVQAVRRICHETDGVVVPPTVNVSEHP